MRRKRGKIEALVVIKILIEVGAKMMTKTRREKIGAP
jgi:hypothetical protein